MKSKDDATPSGAHACEPEGIPRKPPPGEFEQPVGWLFGRQLVANMKWILLYVAFKGKLDHRDWMSPEVISFETHKDEFWFDYMADTGDGQKAVYSVAYLCMSDLAVVRNPKPGDDAEFVIEPDAARLDKGGMLLPRGEFLFVGGDTGYHIADYGTLASRFQNPFWWAYRDLFKARARSVMSEEPRGLFGIPGNHDWYDSLDGFNRQFRRPSTGDGARGGVARDPQLMLPTFERRQEASFVALRLPFDWWLWGLDTEEGEIDFRQLQFFNHVRERFDPKRLIVATPEPTTAFGRFARADSNVSKTFEALGLERPFLKRPEPLAEGKCRLDLSGDIHHYARYFGPPPASGESGSYASVMSGGGGAFLHASQTNLKEVPQRALYPSAEVSRARVADGLFKYTNIVKGGWVWLFGALLAFALFFSATVTPSGRDAVDGFRPFVRLGISAPHAAEPYAPHAAGAAPIPRDTFGPDAPEKPVGFYLRALLVVASIVLMGAALAYSRRLFKSTEYDPLGAKRREVPTARRLVVWALVAVAFACFAYGLWGLHGYYESSLSRYARSLVVFAALVWAALAFVESLWYSDWLFEEAHRRNVEPWRYWPVWGLLALAVALVGAALWFFGRHEAAFLISDIILTLVIVGSGVGLTFFAYGKGGYLLKGRRRAALLLLGASHALLQLAVPFLLARKGVLILAPLAALAFALLFKYVGRALAKLESGRPLVLAWAAFGAALLYMPFLLHTGTPEGVNAPAGVASKLLMCFYAAAVGAVMSCVIFAWYLAVAIAFNAHVDEAGGAARIEDFKEFIRFRLDRDGLTGYVIGVDEVNTEGGAGNLRPKVIDVFHIGERHASRRGGDE